MCFYFTHSFLNRSTFYLDRPLFATPNPERNDILQLDGRMRELEIVNTYRQWEYFIWVRYRSLSYIIQCHSSERQKDTGRSSCSGCLLSLKVIQCSSVQSSCWHYMPHGVSNTLDYMHITLLYYVKMAALYHYNNICGNYSREETIQGRKLLNTEIKY